MGSLYFKLKSCLFVISSGIMIIFSTNKAHFTHDHAVISIYAFMFLKLHLRCLLLASFLSLLSSCSCWTFTQNPAITKLLLQQLTNTVPFQAQRNSIQSQLDMHTYLDCGQAVPLPMKRDPYILMTILQFVASYTQPDRQLFTICTCLSVIIKNVYIYCWVLVVDVFDQWVLGMFMCHQSNPLLNSSPSRSPGHHSKSWTLLKLS